MNDIIWHATLDEDAYKCEVVRTGGYTGQLTVLDTRSNEFVLKKDVGLSYGAQFGPDIGDISQWEEWIIEAVDNQ
jgi:hypothetical protein